MCFCAAASFVTAAVTGALGVVALIRTTHWREAPLAAMPLLFGLQQGVEGLLWLTLSSHPQGAAAQGLALTFLIAAELFWPIYAPITLLLLEPDAKRRRWMLPWLGLGVLVSAYLLRGLLSGPHGAHIVNGHVVYLIAEAHPNAIALAYEAAVMTPFLLSTHKTIKALGVVVMVGCAATYAFYTIAFISVWCFFAATASALIVGHFEWMRWRGRDPLAA